VGAHQAVRSSGCRAPGTRSRAPCCGRSCGTCHDSTRTHSATGLSPPCSMLLLFGMLAKGGSYHHTLDSESVQHAHGDRMESTCWARGTLSSPPRPHCWLASYSTTRTAHRRSSSCHRRCIGWGADLNRLVPAAALTVHSAVLVSVANHRGAAHVWQEYCSPFRQQPDTESSCCLRQMYPLSSAMCERPCTVLAHVARGMSLHST
jgi:hypothetical protein